MGSEQLKFHLHLVSDATGETLKSVAKAALAQFQHSTDVEQHVWALIRTPAQMERVAEAITNIGGLVLYTIVDPTIRKVMIDRARKDNIASLSVLDPVINVLAKMLGEKASNLPGRQHELGAEYFARIDAMNFTLAHDDGQMTQDLPKADIILVGVSRTSKTPTSIYLAQHGIKTANVPIVPGLPHPPELDSIDGNDGPMVVGLTTNPERLVQVRRNRLQTLNENREITYIDIEAVKSEVTVARKLFSQHSWPVIDVTRRSIEETAAAILNLYQRRNGAGH